MRQHLQSVVTDFDLQTVADSELNPLPQKEYIQ
jgi:hypothetical protein